MNFHLVKVDDFQLTVSAIGATLIASQPAQAGIPLRAPPPSGFPFGRRLRAAIERPTDSQSWIVRFHATTIAQPHRAIIDDGRSPHPRN
jgi:hypothetical protein